MASTSRVLIAVISTLWDRKELDQLNAHLSILSKKHGQLRQATVKMVDHAMTYLDQLSGDEKLKFIDALREVTEGKVRLDPFSSRGSEQLTLRDRSTWKCKERE